MATLDYYLPEEETSQQPKLTAFDYTTKLIVPVLAIVATVLLAFYGKKSAIIWGLMGLAALSLALGFSGQLKNAIAALLEGRKDRRAVKFYFPRLQKLVVRFGDFVDGGRSDTLHYIADSFLCEGHGQRIALLGMPNMAAWSGRFGLFAGSLDCRRPTLAGLQLAVLEFHDLLGTYINLCAATVFSRLPQELATTIPPRARVELAAFQQRFERYVSDAELLLKEISQSRASLNRIPYSFAAVKPLA